MTGATEDAGNDNRPDGHYSKVSRGFLIAGGIVAATGGALLGLLGDAPEVPGTALVISGAVAAALGVIGRLPTRISAGGVQFDLSDTASTQVADLISSLSDSKADLEDLDPLLKRLSSLDPKVRNAVEEARLSDNEATRLDNDIFDLLTGPRKAATVVDRLALVPTTKTGRHPKVAFTVTLVETGALYVIEVITSAAPTAQAQLDSRIRSIRESSATPPERVVVVAGGAASPSDVKNALREQPPASVPLDIIDANEIEDWLTNYELIKPAQA